jgi:hypothetical protein
VKTVGPCSLPAPNALFAAKSGIEPADVPKTVQDIIANCKVLCLPERPALLTRLRTYASRA